MRRLLLLVLGILLLGDVISAKATGISSDDLRIWEEIHEVLYVHKDYEKVTEYINGLRADTTELGTYKVSRLYSFLTAIDNAEDIEAMQAVLDEWLLQHPQSHLPLLFSGKFAISLAWHYRGSSWAKNVPEQSWPLFRNALADAHVFFEQAFALQPEDPNSSSHLITVAMGLGLDRDTTARYFDNALKACPWHLHAHVAMGSYLNPKWHGTSTDMIDFAAATLKKAGEYPLLGLVMVKALNEIRLYNSKKENIFLWPQTWMRIERVFRTITTAYPDDVFAAIDYCYYLYAANQYSRAADSFDACDELSAPWYRYTQFHSLPRYNAQRSNAYNQVGQELVWDKKSYTEALPYLEKSIAARPTANAYYNLGMALWNIAGQRRDITLLARVEECLMQATALEPEHPQATQQLANIRSTRQRAGR